jgi:hypothetical protein
MAIDFGSIPPTDAIGVSASLLATMAGVSTPRSSTSKLAAAAAVALPGLTADAQAAHDALVAALSARDGAVLHRGEEVQDALHAEKVADRITSALYGRVSALEKQGMKGAPELRKYLFSEGVGALTRATGRPQRARYEQWIGTWAARPQQGSPADLDIAAAMAEVREAVERFASILDGKDHVSRAADVAIDGRADAIVRWVAAIEELTAAVRAVQWGHEDAFDDWLSPYIEWRQAQEARARRGELAGTAGAAYPPSSDGAGMDGAQDG